MKYFTKEWMKRGSSVEDYLRAREQIYKEIPQDLAEQFGFHDGSVISFEQINGDVVLLIDRHCQTFADYSRFVKVTFENAEVIERDDNLKFASKLIYVDGREQVDTLCTWLYDELYKTDNGYEAHMLLLDQWEWGYLTIVCRNIMIENVTEQQLQSVDCDKAICEKVKTSFGLQQIVFGNLHDASVAEAQAVGTDFVLTLDLNECETKDNACYRKVARITFKNVSDCSVKNCDTLVGYFVSRHREETADGKIRFAFELWNENNNMLPLILHCDDVTVEYSLVDD